jgi:hypothetical protein
MNCSNLFKAVILPFRWLLQHRTGRQPVTFGLPEHEPLPGGVGRGDEVPSKLERSGQPGSCGIGRSGPRGAVGLVGQSHGGGKEEGAKCKLTCTVCLNHEKRKKM